jgi:hypothetical protein
MFIIVLTLLQGQASDQPWGAGIDVISLSLSFSLSVSLALPLPYEDNRRYLLGHKELLDSKHTNLVLRPVLLLQI